jgi:outer membrane protein assembly factor BamA
MNACCGDCSIRGSNPKVKLQRLNIMKSTSNHSTCIVRSRTASQALRWLFAASIAATVNAACAAPTSLPDGEVTINVGVEVSNESDIPLTFVGSVNRTQLLVRDDLIAADARVGRDRTLVGLQYDRPVAWGAFNRATARIEYRDEVITASGAKRERYSALALLGNACYSGKPLLYCAGLGVRRVSYGYALPLTASDFDLSSTTVSTTTPVINGSVSYDRIDGDLHFPTGFVTALDAEIAPINKAGRYTKGTLRHTHFLGCGEFPIRLKLRGEVSRLSSGRFATPGEQRLFGGGFDGVRGYAGKGVSPFSRDGALLGADTKLLGSAELMMQAFELGGLPFVTSAFYDAARFTTKEQTAVFERADVRSYGLALTVPFKQGLVRLAVARPLDARYEQQRFQIEVRANW